MRLTSADRVPPAPRTPQHNAPSPWWPSRRTGVPRVGGQAPADRVPRCPVLDRLPTDGAAHPGLPRGHPRRVTAGEAEYRPDELAGALLTFTALLPATLVATWATDGRDGLRASILTGDGRATAIPLAVIVLTVVTALVIRRRLSRAHRLRLDAQPVPGRPSVDG